MIIPDIVSRALRVGIDLTRPFRYRVDELSYRATYSPHVIAELRRAWVGRPALVVANGPSLNKTPLDLFSGVRAIGMNKIDLIFSRTSWRPTLIVCENNIVVKQHARAMAAHGIPVHLSWKARKYVPRDIRGRFHYFLSRNTSAFATDLAGGLGTSATVTFVALQYAYYLGADPVVIVGCDHSFTFAGAPSNYQTMKTEDPNHFDPNYFGKGTVWGTPNLELSERGYRAADAAFRADGRTILDATIDGKLQIFQKISITAATELLTSRS